MQINVKHCACGRIRFKNHGESTWSQWYQGKTLAQFQNTYDVVSVVEEQCDTCYRKKIDDMAQHTGSVT